MQWPIDILRAAGPLDAAYLRLFPVPLIAPQAPWFSIPCSRCSMSCPPRAEGVIRRPWERRAGRPGLMAS